MMERNEKLQGELHIVQGRLREVEQQFGEQQTLMLLQQTQQQQHQQQQQHHTDELKSLRMQRDAWEAEVRHSKSVVSDLVATNARLQVRRLKILFDLSLPSFCAVESSRSPLSISLPLRAALFAAASRLLPVTRRVSSQRNHRSERRHPRVCAHSPHELRGRGAGSLCCR